MTEARAQFKYCDTWGKRTERRWMECTTILSTYLRRDERVWWTFDNVMLRVYVFLFYDKKNIRSEILMKALVSILFRLMVEIGTYVLDT